jgi:hypothetical protein
MTGSVKEAWTGYPASGFRLTTMDALRSTLFTVAFSLPSLEPEASRRDIHPMVKL